MHCFICRPPSLPKPALPPPPLQVMVATPPTRWLVPWPPPSCTCPSTRPWHSSWHRRRHRRGKYVYRGGGAGGGRTPRLGGGLASLKGSLHPSASTPPTILNSLLTLYYSAPLTHPAALPVSLPPPLSHTALPATCPPPPSTTQHPSACSCCPSCSCPAGLSLPPTTLTLPRGDVMLLGGDLTYPNPSQYNYENRLFLPFEYALPPPPHYHPNRLVVHKPDLPPGGSAGAVVVAVAHHHPNRQAVHKPDLPPGELRLQQ